MARVLMVLCLTAGALWAQDPLPAERYVQSLDTDFPGADLGPLFDTSAAACQRACSARAACAGYTHNTRSNACFPKASADVAAPFVGAVSARKVVTPDAAQTLALLRIADLPPTRAEDLAQARALVGTLAQQTPAGGLRLEDVLRAYEVARADGVRDRMLLHATQAVVLRDASADWARFAEMGLLPGEGLPRDRARMLRRQTVPAALNAYLRAEGVQAQAEALDLLARAYEANGRGREMIAPLRLAERIAPGVGTARALEAAIAKYGFRVVDTRVEYDSARPRLCAVFSELLAPRGTDFAPYVRLNDPRLVVSASERELCIDGVTHGARYSVTLRRGLPAASGEVLHRDTPVTLYVRDRAPTVRFAGRAYVLPRGGDAALPVETVNTDAVELVLRRISDRSLLRAMQESYFGRPLSKYQEDAFADTIAQEIWRGTGDVQNTLNVAMTTRLPLAEALADQPPGIYALSAAIAGQDPYDSPAATQWFILSDLGISSLTGTDGLHVGVRGLGDAQPRAGVTVTLINRANAVLGTAQTGADGRAHFAAGLIRGEGAAAPALILADAGGEDAAFLSLRDPAFDLSDRGVEGRPPSPPIDTFLTTDRGAYRPGEVIHATALTRDAAGRAVNGLPLVAVLTRPDGVEHARTLSQNARAGGHVFALPLDARVPRGAWRLDMIADPALGPLASTTVLVEDFLPDRIAFEMSLPDEMRLQAGQRAGVKARYLFGAPGADLRVEGEVRLRLQRRLEAYPGAFFGRHDAQFDTATAAIGATQTDAQGQAIVDLRLPQVTPPPATPLEAVVRLRVAEGSGRAVEREQTRVIVPDGPMIGIRPVFDGPLPQGGEAAFELIATGGEMPAQVTFNRVETRYQWFRSGGRWSWEPITRRVRVQTDEVTLSGAPVPLRLPTDWGQYEVVVQSVAAPQVASSILFTSGWGGDGARDTPDALPVTLDRESYAVGETATMRFEAEADGVALVSVLSNRVIAQRSVPVTAGDVAIPLTVTQEWGHSAYVTATLITPMDRAAGRNPARRLGLAHVRVAPVGKVLDVTLDAPAEVDGQAGILRVPVQIDGIAAGETAHLTLAAVDVGILNLTAFEPPDPGAHYFGQRRLGVGMRDLYGRLIDGLNGAMGQVRSGGDAVTAPGAQAPPPTEALMARFSGPVTVDAQGRATIEIARPAFNGTIRLMAVAWSDSGVGHAVSDVVARDPVVLTASLPRLLAPGDESRLLLEFTHTRGDTGPMALRVLADAGVAVGAVPERIEVLAGQTVRVPVDLRGREPGDHEVIVTLTPPEGDPLTRRYTLPVRNNDPATAVTQRFSLGAGESFTFDSAVFADLRAGTASATLTAGPLARLDVPGLLRQLDRYPYGCSEQVTSAALPLLAMGDLAGQSGIDAPARLREAVDLLAARQSGNGGFGLWGAGSGNLWLDAYVTDFLTRAADGGVSVPARVRSRALDNLRNGVNFAPDFDLGGEGIAYALLVLARAGAAQIGDLRYYADAKATQFATPMAAAQLGAALASYGDPTRADAMFTRAASLLARRGDPSRWRDDFGSDLRDRAAVLHLAAEAGSEAVDRDALAGDLGRVTRALSTQEAAHVALAARALQGAPSDLRLDGAPVQGTAIKILRDTAPQSHRLTNAGDTPVDVTVTTLGVPEVPPEAGGTGYALRRTLYTLQGEPVSGPVPSGARLIVVLDLQPFESTGARLMIDDPLPGGFEIDNPNLLRSGDIAQFDWITAATPRHVEFRADRFLAAIDRRDADPVQLAYVVRAVTPGSYHHPAALVTDMYRPASRATTGTGRVIVTP
ncbi:alpha-2-macroglobulin family protein [Sulfitobacter albidus]|uniref:Alpha-2-macroglobulin family protein n=1 Tax=Sulfitobacter albidus TaxID=2829501 RepID=A0A975PM50_9RHOB|nr:alpha-2-macroglobulin family protein [Sulfitobacter albidus]QUJ76354.1 alpha-2-macroglobulin family protein [Sulfitobacter albidus]